jgi:hypothetical protein
MADEVPQCRKEASDLASGPTPEFAGVASESPDNHNTRRQPVSVENPEPRFVLSRIAHKEGVVLKS